MVKTNAELLIKAVILVVEKTTMDMPKHAQITKYKDNLDINAQITNKDKNNLDTNAQITNKDSLTLNKTSDQTHLVLATQTKRMVHTDHPDLFPQIKE